VIGVDGGEHVATGGRPLEGHDDWQEVAVAQLAVVVGVDGAEEASTQRGGQIVDVSTVERMQHCRKVSRVDDTVAVEVAVLGQVAHLREGIDGLRVANEAREVERAAALLAS